MEDIKNLKSYELTILVKENSWLYEVGDIVQKHFFIERADPTKYDKLAYPITKGGLTYDCATYMFYYLVERNKSSVTELCDELNKHPDVLRYLLVKTKELQKG